MEKSPVPLAGRRALEYLEGVADRPVRALATSEELRQILATPLTGSGEPAESVINRLADAGLRGTVATQGPRYFGFVVGGSLPVATAADWLVSAWDQNCGIYALSPIVSVVEDVAASWLRDLAGLPPAWSVGFVTGCQMANFTAIAAARHKLLADAGWDVNANGLFGAPPIHVIVSDEAHYTIFAALRLLGLGAERLTRIPTDEQGRMRVEPLRAALRATTGPAIVCAQAGNVNTGAFDPIADIANAARERGAWLHVDGAFGLWAAASAPRRHLVTGVDRADSVATDAHKWLNVPYDCGVAFCAHPEAHRRAMSLSAAYIVENAAERDPHEFVPEESRRARAVPVYAALATLGRDGLADLVERSCRLASRMAARLSRHDSLRVLNDVVLNQVLVRVEQGPVTKSPERQDARERAVASERVRGPGMKSPEQEEDALTRDMIARLQEDGTCWAGGTTWHGMAALRISVSNWSTTEADIDRSADAIMAAADAAVRRSKA